MSTPSQESWNGSPNEFARPEAPHISPLELERCRKRQGSLHKFHISTRPSPGTSLPGCELLTKRNRKQKPALLRRLRSSASSLVREADGCRRQAPTGAGAVAACRYWGAKNGVRAERIAAYPFRRRVSRGSADGMLPLGEWLLFLFLWRLLLSAVGEGSCQWLGGTFQGV